LNANGLRSPAQADANISGCVIGRFNAAASAAGPNALPVFNGAGTQVGFCTPVFWDLIGGSVPGAADVAAGSTDSNGGYYTTEIITVDQAGNQAAPFTRTVVADAVAPTVTSIDLPGSLTGGATATFPATANDNLDVVGAYAAVTYNSAGMTLRYPNVTGPGTAFDNVLTRTNAAISPSVTNFIRNLSAPTAGTPAYSASGGAPSSVAVTALDEVGFTGSLSSNLGTVSIAQSTSSTVPFAASTGFTGGFAGSASPSPISNCPTAGCGTAAPAQTSTTLSAVATGASATFNNPFTLVTFWYQNAAGEWVQIGAATGTSVSDVGGATGRSWTYTLVWDPPTTGTDNTSFTPAVGGATQTVNLRAIGQTSNGDAVTTGTFTVQINNG